jgi:ribonuclease-3
LGDSVLHFIVSAHLVRQFPTANEGTLTRIRAKWVCATTLAEIANRLVLKEHVILGQGERRTGGAHRASILADALEAIIGAIFCDAGIGICESVVLSWYAMDKAHLWVDAHHKDPKTRLQEYVQAKRLPLPIYTVMRITGDPHDPVFHVRCEVTALNVVIERQGKGRKAGEQAVAEAVLKQLGVTHHDD